MGAGRRRRDESHLDVTVSSRSRSCVVLRAHGAARGSTGCGLSNRLGRYTMIDASGGGTNDRTFAYFTTVTVTTTLVTSPVIRSAAAVNSVDCPSFKISALLV